MVVDGGIAGAKVHELMFEKQVWFQKGRQMTGRCVSMILHLPVRVSVERAVASSFRRFSFTMKVAWVIFIYEITSTAYS